jgi:hypothetical protein
MQLLLLPPEASHNSRMNNGDTRIWRSAVSHSLNFSSLYSLLVKVNIFTDEVNI